MNIITSDNRHYRYQIVKEDRTYLAVSNDVHDAILAHAQLNNISVVEATYVIICKGIEAIYG